jgi:hypothetical protein
MNSLEKAIKADGLKIKSLIAKLEEKATENDLGDFVQRINPSVAPSAPNIKYNFKDSFGNTFNKGWGNYGKS